MLAMETDDHRPAVACQQKERLQLLELLPCFLAALAAPTPSLPSKPPPAAPGRLHLWTQHGVHSVGRYSYNSIPAQSLTRKSAEKHMAGGHGDGDAWTSR
jgi:hypothetical protein